MKKHPLRIVLICTSLFVYGCNPPTETAKSKGIAQNPIALNNLAIEYVEKEEWDLAKSYFEKAKEKALDYNQQPNGPKTYLMVTALMNPNGLLGQYYTIESGNPPPFATDPVDIKTVINRNIETITNGY